MSASDKKVSIQFLGAAGTVTGSKHLLKTPDGDFLIDCGLFQGLKELRLRNWEPLPVDVSKISCVLLTHAHLDHCGYLPLLFKQGFKGKVYCTAPTRDLTEIILRDSAKIQEEDSDLANREGFSRHHPAEPLYTERDVERILSEFMLVRQHEAFDLTKNISATYHGNGHILGSAFIELKCFGKTIVFSGDLGRPESALLPPPSPITPQADYIIMESTYGDRLHPATPANDELATIVNDTIQRKGNLLIPSFAVGRAQELMHLINELKKANRIPNIPVFMDSPMGANATDIFRSHPDWHKLSLQQCNSIFEDVTIISKFQDTLKTIEDKRNKIVIAASGMLTGGRVLTYLEHYLEKEKNTILFVGYQSEGTRGRAIVRGSHEVKIHGRYFQILLQVHSIASMSGHADQKEMIDWLRPVKSPPQTIFLVHGENAPREAFRLKIESELKWNVQLPAALEEATLFFV
ncbi:MAG TPA: MBL fold metallo-hydrolase [Cyclobacteriaceae bacterium]|nr:MBL fold metallo-hydrolase [Cyclobacteriaceae bacterium]